MDTVGPKQPCPKSSSGDAYAVAILMQGLSHSHTTGFTLQVAFRSLVLPVSLKSGTGGGKLLVLGICKTGVCVHIHVL